jgi:hypothetical protein
MAEPYDAPTTDELEAMFGDVQPPMNQGDLVPRGREVSGSSMMVQDQIITAQVVSVPRDNAKILKGLQFAAAYAGDKVLNYRWQVKNRRTGKLDTVQGLTIKAADILLREYTNAYVDLRFNETSTSWVYKATFVDLERGIARPAFWQEYKGTSRLGARDDTDQRLKQLPFQVGQSKAIRNVIVKYLEIPYGTYLQKEGENNLIERVSKDIAAYRERCKAALANLGVDLVRVERQVGRKLADWLAPDVSMVIQQIKAVRDHMLAADDQWPADAPPEPKRSDPEPETSAAAAAQPTTPPETAANGGPTPDTKTATAPPEPSPAGQASDSTPPPADEPAHAETVDLSMPLEAWTVGDDVIGQENIIKRLEKLIDMAETRADVDAIETQNAERIGRITGVRRGNLNGAIRIKRERLR